jgi:hypothetical protein
MSSVTSVSGAIATSLRLGVRQRAALGRGDDRREAGRSAPSARMLSSSASRDLALGPPDQPVAGQRR